MTGYRINLYTVICTCIITSTAFAAGGSNDILVKAKLANSYRDQCEYYTSKNLISVCQQLINNEPDPYDKALLDVYLEMAEYYLLADRPIDLAKECLKKATLILKTDYADSRWGVLYLLKGIMYFKDDEYVISVNYLKQSLFANHSESGMNRFEYLAYQYLDAINVKYVRNYSSALEYSLEMISLCIKTGQSPASFYCNAGYSALMLQDTVKAKNFTLKSLEHCTDDASGTKTASLAYANLFCIDHKVQTAQKAIEKAKKVAPKGLDLAEIYNSIFLEYYDDRQFKVALSYAQQGLIALSENFSDTSVLMNPSIEKLKPQTIFISSLLNKGVALRGINAKNSLYYKTALNAYEMCAKLAENKLSDIRDERSALFIIERMKTAYSNTILMCCHLQDNTKDSSYAEKAFNYSEKIKMKVLLNSKVKKEKLIKSEVPPALIDFISRLDDKIMELQNRLSYIRKYKVSANEKEMSSQLMRLYDTYDSLETELMNRYPLYRKYRFEVTPPPDIKKIQHSLPEDQVLLEYTLVTNNAVIFFISNDDFFMLHSTWGRKFYARMSKQLRNTISTSPQFVNTDSNYYYMTQAARVLYRELIAPVYDHIFGKRLIIVANDELALIPFEVLMPYVPQVNNTDYFRNLPYMIREFPIIYAYSASMLVDQETPKKYGSGTAVYLPDYDSYNESEKRNQFRNLEGAAKEALHIRKITGGRLFSGSRCTETQFRKKAPGYRILHIAAHTIVDWEEPGLSCLVMNAPKDSTEDGFLYEYELRRLLLNAQLIVLSGCNTGFGRLSKSDGLVSIARSFFYTSVRTVVYTFWQVPDNAGSQLIELFYDGLKRKQRLEVAMQKAKVEYLKKCDPVQAHPFYWANYVVLGKSEVIPIEKKTGLPQRIILIIIFSISGFIIYKKITS